MNIIETTGLTKVYSSAFGKKKVQALVDLNISIKKGTIFGLLGPNGAGKTTLIKILLGITYQTAGNAEVLQQKINGYKYKKKIGYLPENHKYPSYLTGEEVLKFFGKLSGVDESIINNKMEELLDLVKLKAWRKSKIKTYSKGMMQRLGLAQALINDPELIFLDEPTDGVDPIGRKEIRDILIDLKKKEKTIFLNSHLLSEVEMITDRVGILNKGRLIREGSVQELTEKKEEYKIRIDVNDSSKLNDNDFEKFKFSELKDGFYSVKVEDTNDLNKLIDLLRKKGILIFEINPTRSSLEDTFVSLIEKAETEGKQ